MINTLTIAICALLVSGCNLVLNWNIYRTNKSKVNSDRIEKLETAFAEKVTSGDTDLGKQIASLKSDMDTKLDAQGKQIARLEERSGAAITHKDLIHIHDRVNVVNDKVSTIDGKLDGVESSLRLILKRITERGMP